MRSSWRTKRIWTYLLGVVALLACPIADASAQIRPNRGIRQAEPSLAENVKGLETDLARLNSRVNYEEQLHLDELKTLAAKAPANLEEASAERLREILKAFDAIPRDRRNSAVSGLATFQSTHKSLQAFVSSLPKPKTDQDEAKRGRDPALKLRTREQMQEQPKGNQPGVPGGNRNRELTKPAQIQNVRTWSGPVPCYIIPAPRPRGWEQRRVLSALDHLERDVFQGPEGAALRRSFPFGELKTAASVPKAGVESQRRLGELLKELNALSLDPAHRSQIRDESVADLHDHLRELVELANVDVPSVPLAPANDLAATELYGTVDNWKSAKWLIRLHIVACADDDGGRKSTMTKAQVQQGIALANKVFEPAQLRFVFDPEKDWEELKNTKINSWDLVEHDKNAAAYAKKPALQSKVVIYSAFGPDPVTPNGWAANGGTHVWVPSGGVASSTLCHELGHFLGHLYHTFPGDGRELVYGKDPSKITAANVDKMIADFIYDPSRNKSGTTTEQAMDGDGFTDTPPDPGADYWAAKWPGHVCDPAYPTATVPNPKGGPAWVFTPDRTNLLSYFFDCVEIPKLTSQQAAAILGRLEGTVPQSDGKDLKRLIAGQTAWSFPSGDLVIVGKVRNVGTATSIGGRTAVLESVGEANTANVPLGAPVTIGPLAPNDWVLVKVPMSGGLSWKGKACLKISPGDGNAANDTFCPEPYKAPPIK